MLVFLVSKNSREKKKKMYTKQNDKRKRNHNNDNKKKKHQKRKVERSVGKKNFHKRHQNNAKLQATDTYKKNNK